MQYLAGGTLIEYVSKHFAGRRMSEQFGRSVFRQLASALDYLHNKKMVVHRDIKPGIFLE
jgi:serine/threonine protein kinase